MPSVVIAGGGVFGAGAAVALRERGFEVTVVEPGPLPHPLAESTDVSKIVRLDYGSDETYTAFMETALACWREGIFAPFLHETGLLFFRQAGALEPGTFEGDSFDLLTRRGHALQRVDDAAVRARFPAWTAEGPLAGYYNPQGGWAESGNVVVALGRRAKDQGATLVQGDPVASLLEEGRRVAGVRLVSGQTLRADFVVVAAGAWSPLLVPSAREAFVAVGQPVFFLRPRDPAPFAAPAFPVFGADIARTGYYGFPATPAGLVKIANHGAGVRIAPDAKVREVSPEQTDALRAFLGSFSSPLSLAPIATDRLCVYCDTPDQHFLIAPEPDRPGLVVAAGGSGHAFKFAPLVGGWIADAVEGKVVPRFRWRSFARARGEEQARASE